MMNARYKRIEVLLHGSFFAPEGWQIVTDVCRWLRHGQNFVRVDEVDRVLQAMKQFTEIGAPTQSLCDMWQASQYSQKGLPKRCVLEEEDADEPGLYWTDREAVRKDMKYGTCWDSMASGSTTTASILHAHGDGPARKMI
jgi:hypothetical protein